MPLDLLLDIEFLRFFLLYCEFDHSDILIMNVDSLCLIGIKNNKYFYKEKNDIGNIEY